MLKDQIKGELESHFGLPIRTTKKVWAWEPKIGVGLVLQRDQPNSNDLAYLWLPHPGDGAEVPELAFEYPGEMGRHSNTHPSKGLARGEPALLFRICSISEALNVINYLQSEALVAPDFDKEQAAQNNEKKNISESNQSSNASEVSFEPREEELERVDVQSMPEPKEKKPRRKAIPRVVQREVWQRDGGRCVECDTRKLLCYDHIVPFSLGGSNTVRNIQLLCEGCNLSKGNRI